MDLRYWNVESITKIRHAGLGVDFDVYCDEACVSSAVVGNKSLLEKRILEFPSSVELSIPNMVDWITKMKELSVRAVEIHLGNGVSAWVYRGL